VCVWVYSCVCVCVFEYMYKYLYMHLYIQGTIASYGVASVSRIDKIIGLLCKRAL